MAHSNLDTARAGGSASTSQSQNEPRAVLSASKLTVTFAGGRRSTHPIEAVRGIDFEVREGQTLAVVGESGSGKSASLLAIVGLLPPTARVSGNVQFAGQDLLGLDKAGLRKIRGSQIGFVFQDPNSSLHPQKTIGAQLDEVVRLHSPISRQARHDHVIGLLDRVGIVEPRQAYSTYPFEYSGGMKQRAMIAMALANRPRLLIADEPTTALDTTVQASIVQLLSDLQDELGTAIVFVNHDLAVAYQLADTVIVMRHGRIIESGPRQSVYHNPHNPYTRKLLAASVLHTTDSIDQPTVALTRRPRENEAAASNDQSVARLLELHEVSKTYRCKGRRQRRRILDRINLQVGTGEIVALVGESGSGKSTIGKIVAGLQYADTGIITLAGQHYPTAVSDMVPPLGQEQRRQVQMVFQDSYSSLNPRRTVRDSITAPMRAKKAPAAIVETKLSEVSDLTGLDSRLLDRYPAQLSGGQRQRVAIARALVLGPRLIVADEAISALDVTAQAELIDTIHTLKLRSQTSFLLITHDLGLARHLADQVIVLSPRGIEDSGPPAQIFNQPRSQYTRALIAAVPRIGGRAA